MADGLLDRPLRNRLPDRRTEGKFQRINLIRPRHWLATEAKDRQPIVDLRKPPIVQAWTRGLGFQRL
jgi:hypothetical protein